MGKIVNAIFFPVTMGRFPTFCLFWGIISTVIETLFLTVLGRTMFAGAFFIMLSALGVILSYTSIGRELKGTKLKLDWWQLLRSLPAIILMISISKHPNMLSVNIRILPAIIFVLVGFWSSQLAIVIRSILPLKQ